MTEDAKVMHVAFEFFGPDLAACEKQAEYWQDYIELENGTPLVEERRQVEHNSIDGVRLRIAWKVTDG